MRVKFNDFRGDCFVPRNDGLLLVCPSLRAAVKHFNNL